MTQPFGFEQALKDLRAGKELGGKDDILTPLIKQLTEAALSAEIVHHLEHSDQPNRRNGKHQKL